MFPSIALGCEYARPSLYATLGVRRLDIVCRGATLNTPSSFGFNCVYRVYPTLSIVNKSILTITITTFSPIIGLTVS